MLETKERGLSIVHWNMKHLQTSRSDQLLMLNRHSNLTNTRRRKSYVSYTSLIFKTVLNHYLINIMLDLIQCILLFGRNSAIPKTAYHHFSPEEEVISTQEAYTINNIKRHRKGMFFTCMHVTLYITFRMSKT